MNESKQIQCYICKSPSQERLFLDEETNDYVLSVFCPRCRTYEIDQIAKTTIASLIGNDRKRRAYLSSWIYGHVITRITREWVENPPQISEPSLGEKATKLLRRLAFYFPTVGMNFSLAPPDKVRLLLDSVERGEFNTLPEKLKKVAEDNLRLVSAGWIIYFREPIT